MKNEIKYAVFNKTEGLIESIIKDATTLAVTSLLVFIFWVVAKITVITKQRYKTFKTKAELQEWVDALKD